MTEDELHTATTDHYNWLSNCLKDAETQEPEAFHLQGRWAGLHPPPKFRTSWNTGKTVRMLDINLSCNALMEMNKALTWLQVRQSYCIF